VIHDAETRFLNSYNGIVTSPGSFTLTQDTVTSAAKAAGALGMGGTAQGAVNLVSGLVAAVESGSAPELVGAFTGDAIAALTAAGALTGGVGAAVVVGIELAGAGLAALLGSSGGPTTNVCGCSIQQSAGISISFGCCYSNGTATPQGPGSKRYWRSFPAKSNPADAWWFQYVDAQEVPGGDYEAFATTTWGPAGDTWGVCIKNSGGRRPIDAACIEFPQLDCDVTAATPIAALPDGGGVSQVLGIPIVYSANDVAWARFQRAFYSAWCANREYLFNGLKPPMGEADLLTHTIAVWNNAHSSVTTMTKTAPVNLSPNQLLFANDPCGNRPYPDQSYIMMLAKDAAGGVITINTGPLKMQVKEVSTTGGFKLTPVFGASKPAGKTSGALIAVGALFGVAALAAGGVGLYAWRSGQSYGQAWKSVLGMAGEQTTASGKLLADAGPHKLLLKRAAEEPAKPMRPQSLLFPIDHFTPAQAKAWARAHNFKAAKVDTTEQYHRIRQFSPAKSTVLRTIPFGDSGIKAVVAR